MQRRAHKCQRQASTIIMTHCQIYSISVYESYSIEVINRTTDQRVPYARNEDFAYGDRGRLEWV
jgi:hypothetical protein